MKYRNIKTGVVIDCTSDISGENWEKIEEKRGKKKSVKKKEGTDQEPNLEGASPDSSDGGECVNPDESDGGQDENQTKDGDQ